MKKKEFSKNILYVFLPLIQFTLYSNILCKPVTSTTIIYGLIIINSFTVALIAGMSISSYYTQYLIITIIYLIIFGGTYMIRFMPNSIANLWSPLLTTLVWCQDIVYIWIGGFIYNLLKFRT